ncbi:MAG: O-antigen ligase family protein [Shewanella sp.]
MFSGKNNKIANLGLNILPIILGVGIFTSKAIINIALPLIYIATCYLIIKKQDDKKSRIFIYVFISGLILNLLGSKTTQDSLLYFKNFTFLLIPTLIAYAIANKNKDAIIKAIIFGFIVSLTLFLSKNAHSILNWHGEGLTSQWDIGRWREIIVYFLCIALPLVMHERKKINSIAISMLIILSLMALILSIGRTGYIIIACIFLPYILWKKWRSAIWVSMVLLLAASFMPRDLSDNITSRIRSIANIKTDASNIGRVYMWKNGIDFTYHNYKKEVTTFLFGTGAHSFEDKNTNFIEEIGDKNFLTLVTKNQFSFNDPHNGYLDILLKYGVIFSVVFYALIINTTRMLLLNKGGRTRDIALLCLLSWLLQGVFYTNSTSYQAIMVFTIISLGLFSENENES